ncbi:hypothetical protein C2E20_5391 [Micractinium conductrix]|uniref:Uncharacterized protein n=1 Tax=Micractinium conductrix TaxID=554055 RepID=A0A2P6VBE1_9CHLO|nr:hypothetical protein C2E20_5391 [Micractinium conductrix]|eukprot:PSC71388.1 hypothetical protein C2E20_5391 [Micractinium conductrix]
MEQMQLAASEAADVLPRAANALWLKAQHAERKEAARRQFARQKREARVLGLAAP